MMDRYVAESEENAFGATKDDYFDLDTRTIWTGREINVKCSRAHALGGVY